jgi:peptide/nickel transport system substrate-binding protein
MNNYLPNRAMFVASTALALLILALLVGCSSLPLPGAATPTPIPTLAPPTATPLPRGGTLAVRLDADIPNLRPWQPRSRSEEQVISLLYSGLTRLDATLQPQPDLARSWEASGDGRLITMTLQSTLVWHDGTPLTAEDAAFTLGALRAISPTTALLNDMQRIAAVSTPTSTTLVISLTERYAPIFSMLTVPILPKHVLIDKEIAALDFWQVPIGSGPFQFQGRQPGRTITLTANSSFYRGAPLLDSIAFSIIPDPQQAIAALNDGSLHIAELPWSASQPLSGSTELQIGAYPENGYYFLAFNARQGRPTFDARVRQALAAAIDLPQLVQEVTAGQGIPIASGALPGSWVDLTSVPTATVNLDRARLLLDESGWKVAAGSTIRQQNGLTLTLQLYVRGDDPRRVQAAELIAQAAAQIGMAIQVQETDFETAILPRYAPPYDFDLLLGSWSNGVGDPTFADSAYYDPDDFSLFHSSQINQGTADTRGVLNITGFSDSAYDSHAVAARQIYEPTERVKAIRQAQQQIATLYPYLYLWNDQMSVVLSNKVSSLDGPVNLATPMYWWNVERWYLEP